ncbi:cytochrome P450 6B1-like, partial [Spodoptera litura]|uniref:unspecific monooxygenase n=1 Tax=Spodoptera litura TaxID=69820 RepID=A0A9J7EE88_SPOLT
LKYVQIYSFWRKKGVTGPKPYPFVGNYAPFIFGRVSEGDLLRKIYEQYPNERFVGIYKGVRPVLLLRDPELIKLVMVKDFKYFPDRCIEKTLQIAKSVFTLKGDEEWHAKRKLMTPMYTTSKLTKILPCIQKSADNYAKYVKYLIDNNIDHEIHHLQSKFMLQNVGILTFGVEIDPFFGDNELETALIETTIHPHLINSPIHIANYVCPPLLKMLAPLLQKIYLRRLMNFGHYITSLINKPRDGNDLSHIFLNHMVNLKSRDEKVLNSKLQANVNNTDIIEQTLTIALASYETPSILSGLILYELALHQDIQEKCYQEITTVFEKHDGQLSLQALSEMKYLDMIFDETLRLHPMAHVLDRRPSAKYTFPDTNVTVDKDVFIFIPTHGLQLDAKYYENPLKFDPDRFLPENKDKLQSYTYLPFGFGPRACLGIRASKVLVLSNISLFLRRFKVSPSAKTKPVLKLDPKRLLASVPLGGIWIKIEQRN